MAIGPGPWQDHLARHPLGAHGKVRGNGPAPWNLEGWDRTDPPVITAGRRAKLVAKIGALGERNTRCGVPDFTGRTRRASDVDGICKRCPPALIQPCLHLLNEEDPVGSRYAAVTEALLEAVEDGVVVSATAFKTAVLRVAIRRTGPIDSLTVLSFGVATSDENMAIARVSRADGTRAEFFVDMAARVLRWRTTYRLATSTGPAVRLSSQEAQFVTDLAIPSARFGALSDACIVVRQWWQDHGN